MAESAEVLDQKITLCLQKIEDNFVQATKISASVFTKVKKHNLVLKDISNHLEGWCNGFQSISAQLEEQNKANARITEETDSCTGAEEENYINDPYASPKQFVHKQNFVGTPTTPKFRTALAKTPAILLDDYNKSRLNSSQTKMSPPKSTKLYQPSKTPGKYRYDPDSDNFQSININEDDNHEGFDSPWITSPLEKKFATTTISTPPSSPSPVKNLSESINNENTGISSNQHTPVVVAEKPAFGTPCTPELNSPLAISSLHSMDTEPEQAIHNKLVDLPNEEGCGTPLSERVAALSNKNTAFKSKHTPISIKSAARTRLAVERERRASILLDEFDEPVPEFDLQLFPKCFQSGQGAIQITAVYSCFRESNGESEELSLEQINERLSDFDAFRIELLLDLLVSRRLIIPNADSNNDLHWKLA